MKKLIYKSMVMMAAGLGLAGNIGNLAKATTTDLLLGFNDNKGPQTAQNDYCIDLGMTPSSLINAANTNGGTYVFTNLIIGSTFTAAFGSDANNLNDVAVGLVEGDNTPNNESIYITGPLGTNDLSVWTASNAATWAAAVTLAGAPSAQTNFYPSSTANGVTNAWSQFVAVDPVTPGGNIGGSVAGTAGNPITNLVNGIVTLPLFGSTGTGGRNFTPPPWKQVGTFVINVNNLTVTFTSSSGGTAPTAPTVTSILGSPTNGFVPLNVVFNGTVSGTATNYVWNFGNGTSVTNTTGTGVSATYTASGVYMVSLNVTGPGGSSGLTNSVTVTGYPAPHITSFSKSGGLLVLSGTSGPAGVQYRVISAPTIKTPLANWVPVYTNTFTVSGGFSFTNSMTNASQFFRIVSP
jgi:PKD repeat protein